MTDSASSKSGDASTARSPTLACSSSTISKRVMEGPLSKWTNVVNGWQYRWFVLDQSVGLLSYYTSKDKMKRGSRRGCFRLKRAIIGIDDEDDSTFTIRVENRVYHFQAQNSEERQLWVNALDGCIRRLHQPVSPLDLSLPPSYRSVSLEQLIAETEGYHQLIHRQVQDISNSMGSAEVGNKLRDSARSMLAALGQCILIIKDSQLNQPRMMLNTAVENPSSPLELQTTPTVDKDILEVGPRWKEAEEEPATVTTTEGAANEISNSSTSDNSDEEFFDAEMVGEWSPGVFASVRPTVVSVPVAEGDPSDVEEDEDYDEEDNTSDGVQANKSVIMYMLSQVRVGMDLTKIVLPTFILEKRSLLEMYAEFLAHADIFAAIPDHSDPKDRIIAIVRYYLSSFHAARNGAIAKKPYNPILGETFRCYWDLHNSTRVPPSEEAKVLLESGPVPYASYNSVTFVAEQVSHHPPVSGFYAECPSKNMYVSGSIWTKSKFLGLSLGVHNVGSVNLHLLDYGEVYTCNLPNAYGRSILTIPWLELGGKVNLSCEQTGYRAVIDFHCKPFYGGRKHRITAEVMHVSDRKPILKVEGEWNGVMMSKLANGDEEVFMDTLNTPIYRKKLKRLSAQEPGESRRRWQHVTNALKIPDVGAATDAKHLLEEQQRTDERERKEKGEQWEQKLFHLLGDMWTYNSALDTRKAILFPTNSVQVD